MSAAFIGITMNLSDGSTLYVNRNDKNEIGWTRNHPAGSHLTEPFRCYGFENPMDALLDGFGDWNFSKTVCWDLEGPSEEGEYSSFFDYNGFRVYQRGDFDNFYNIYDLANPDGRAIHYSVHKSKMINIIGLDKLNIV